MLILMFVFVIFGLSIVSMLISVIQIKMEEWLYQMMLKMQVCRQIICTSPLSDASLERVSTCFGNW